MKSQQFLPCIPPLKRFLKTSLTDVSVFIFFSQLIEDLRKQLEHLQLYKLEAEAKRGRTPGAGLQEYQTRTREAELEQEIKRLKQVKNIFSASLLHLYSIFSFNQFSPTVFEKEE